MIARGLLCFHPARLHAPSRPPSKSIISPTYENFSSNSFVSPTCAKTGGYIPQKCRRADIFSLFSQSRLSPSVLPCPPQLQRRRVFNRLRTLSFSVSHRSAFLPTPSALFVQKPGIPPPVIPIPSRTGTAKHQLHYFRGQTNVSAAGGRSVLQRYFSLRGAAARSAASNCWAWSKGREMRNRSARRSWAYFS